MYGQEIWVKNVHKIQQCTNSSEPNYSLVQKYAATNNITDESSVRQNVCNNSKICKKSCFLDFEKNVKNVKKTYRPLNH